MIFNYTDMDYLGGFLGRRKEVPTKIMKRTDNVKFPFMEHMQMTRVFSPLRRDGNLSRCVGMYLFLKCG